MQFGLTNLFSTCMEMILEVFNEELLQVVVHSFKGDDDFISF